MADRSAQRNSLPMADFRAFLSSWIALAVLPLILVSGLAFPSRVARAADDSKRPSILFVNAGWRGLPHEDLLHPRYLADLKEMGFFVDVCRMGELDSARISRYNVAVLLWLPPETHKESVETYRSRLPVLREYVESGGGLFFNYTETGTSVVYERTYFKVTNEFFAPLGLRAIPEVLRDPENTFRQREGMREYFIRTRNVQSHPITRGVEVVSVPTHWWDQNSFRADASWTALVSAEKSGYLTKSVDAPATAKHVVGSIASAPPVLAYRELGKGRIVFDTICPVFTFSDGYHYMIDGIVLRDGGVFQLHTQAFDWLAEPSLRAGKPGGFSGPSYTPATADEIQYTDVKVFRVEGKAGPTMVSGLPTFYGLYGAHSDLSDGAHSDLSDGAATVGALCERAKLLGYSYLVFTEPLGLMSEAKYKRLVELCEVATSEDFLALPGMEYSSDRLWSPRVEQPAPDFGVSMPGRGSGRPRFVITYLKNWVGHKLGGQLNSDEAILSNYPLSPDGSYVVDNGIIYV